MGRIYCRTTRTATRASATPTEKALAPKANSNAIHLWYICRSFLILQIRRLADRHYRARVTREPTKAMISSADIAPAGGVLPRGTFKTRM